MLRVIQIQTCSNNLITNFLKHTNVPVDIVMMPQGNGEKILVVDDDEALRSIYAAAFNRCGYQVTLVEDGRAALELFRKALAVESPFDLIVLDMNMPGMNGQDCAQSIFNLDKNARILIVSGYCNVGSFDIGNCLLGVLEKPVGLNQLMEAVRAGVQSRKRGDGDAAGKASNSRDKLDECREHER